MKLKDKLIKLKQPKNKSKMYKVAIDENDFVLLNNKHFYNVKKEDNLIWFELSLFRYFIFQFKNKLVFKECKFYNYLKRQKEKIVLSICFLVLVVSIFVCNQFFIREITFNDNKYYDCSVYEYVLNNTKKIGPFYLMDKSISKISKELREKFYNFSYVGLSKKGSKLIIEIFYQNIGINKDDSNNQIGEYISTCDAKITYINISSGNVVIRFNDVVKKGDLLVTSNINYNNLFYSKDKLVPIKGNIIGLINSYENITIKKKEEIEVFSDKKNKYYELNIFNKKFNIGSKEFDGGYNYKKQVINIFKQKIFKVYSYEKKKIIIERNINEALEYANYILYERFYQNIVDEKEKIVSINNINVIEKDDEFVFNFFIVAYKNIAFFKKI